MSVKFIQESKDTIGIYGLQIWIKRKYKIMPFGANIDYYSADQQAFVSCQNSELTDINFDSLLSESLWSYIRHGVEKLLPQ